MNWEYWLLLSGTGLVAYMVGRLHGTITMMRDATSLLHRMDKDTNGAVRQWFKKREENKHVV